MLILFLSSVRVNKVVVAVVVVVVVVVVKLSALVFISIKHIFLACSQRAR